MCAEIVVIWGLFIDSHVYLILNGRHTPFGKHMRASERTHKQQQEGICFRPNSRFLTNLHRHTHNHTHFAAAQPVYLYYHIYIDIYLTVVGGRVGELALVAGGSQHAGISTNLKFVICDKYSRMLRLILFGREFQYTHI